MKLHSDPDLPGLAVALDMDALLSLLSDALPECPAEVAVESGQIFDVQYTPGARCLILYRIKFRDASTGRSARQYVSVHALKAGESPVPPSRCALQHYPAFEGRVLRTGWLHLEGLGLAIYAFPLDPVLKSLAEAFDPEAMKDALRALWDARGVRVRRVAASPLGFTPQARAAVRYEVLGEGRASGIPELRYLVGKINAHKPASRLFARSWALWRAAGSRVRLAPPVGYLPRLNMSLQEHIRGERLGDHAGKPGFVKPVRQTARSIAVMHGLSMPIDSKRRSAKEVQGVQRWGSVLAALRPDQAARVKRLRKRLVGALEDRVELSGLVHGDFHPANVLVDDEQVTVIDLDQVALGDPLVDVGRFMASLRVSALRVAGDASALNEIAESFLEQYLSQRADDERRVRLFEASCLMMAAATGFRLQRPGWEENAAELIGEAERTLARAEGGRRVPSTPATPAAARDREISWPEDCVYVRAALEPCIHKIYGAETRSLRAQPRSQVSAGQRLRYRLSGMRAGEKWSVALDGLARRGRGGRRCFERLRHVHDALLDRPEAPRLPRPVAYLPELKLQLVEVPTGVPFIDTVGTEQGAEWAERLALALRALHALPADLDHTHPLERELEAARRQVERLSQRWPEHRVVALWEEVDSRLRAERGRLAPSLRRLPLKHVLCGENGVAFAEVQDVVLGHPHLDVADVLGRMGRAIVSEATPGRAEDSARRLRETYADGEPELDALRNFEAMSLLRLACREVDRDGGDRTASLLLERAQHLLSSTPSGVG